MITQGFLPLVAGYAATAIIVAYSDFRRRSVNDLAWTPALLGTVAFYWGSPLEIFLIPLVSFVVCLPPVWLILRFASKRFGAADAIALGVFALWPQMLFVSLTSLSLFPFFKGQPRGIPFAGLMAVFGLAFLAYLAIP
jgi:hypothetical protein